jgi:hypothetical protein
MVDGVELVVSEAHAARNAAAPPAPAVTRNRRRFHALFVNMITN